MAERAKVLLLVGGPAPYHDTPTHRSSLLDMLTPEFDMTMVDQPDALTSENLAHYDVIANYSTWWKPSEEQCQAVLDFVKYGKGFASLHPGTATFFNCSPYLDMVGGKFVDHDEVKLLHVHTPTAVGGGVAKARFGRFEEEPSPITEGIEAFDVEDELFLVEGDLRLWYVIARAEGHPVVFLKHWGLGRVFNITLGHDERSLGHHSVKDLHIRGIKWAARKL